MGGGERMRARDMCVHVCVFEGGWEKRLKVEWDEDTPSCIGKMEGRETAEKREERKGKFTCWGSPILGQSDCELTLVANTRSRRNYH